MAGGELGLRGPKRCHAADGTQFRLWALGSFGEGGFGLGFGHGYSFIARGGIPTLGMPFHFFVTLFGKDFGGNVEYSSERAA